MNNLLNKAACGLPVVLCLFSANSVATTLEQALIASESYSAELSASAHQVRALDNMAEAAMQLPDPKLEFGIDNLPVQGNNHRRLTRDGMTMQKIGVMQQYVSLTKRQRKAGVIQADARRVAANSTTIRARLQRDTAQAWLALALSQKTLASVEQIIRETRRQQQVQTAGVASGSNSASSVLELKLALMAMQNEQDNVQRDIAIARQKLLQLTGQEITEITGTFPPITRLPVDRTQLANSVQQHPAVIQATREADLAQAKSSQSAVAAIPDVGVEVFYGHRAAGDDDMAGVMFTVDLPLFQHHRQDKDHAADVARAWQANDQLALTLREHQAQLNMLIAQYDAANAIFDRQQNEVLPLLRKKISLINAQYQAGNSSLSELLSARRDLLNGEIASNRAAQAVADSWAAIRYLTPEEYKQ